MTTRHEVRDGECIHSIAERYGFAPDTLWDHPDNEELKEKRGDAAVLEPGDVVVVPERRARKESGATEQKHRFRRKGWPAHLKVQLVIDGEICKDEPYVLDVDGALSEGRTDGEGRVAIPIRPGARRGRVIVRDETFDFGLGTLHPVDLDEGVRQRLENLGFLDEEEADEAQALADAVRRFREAAGLEAGEEIDQDVRDRLTEAHGS